MKLIINVELLDHLRAIGYLADAEYERAMNGNDPRFRSYVDDDFLPAKPVGILHDAVPLRSSKRFRRFIREPWNQRKRR